MVCAIHRPYSTTIAQTRLWLVNHSAWAAFLYLKDLLNKPLNIAIQPEKNAASEKYIIALQLK
jgi:hypothetical protein